MRTLRWLAVLLAWAVAFGAVAQTSTTQSHMIVRKTDFDGAVTFEIVAGRDYTAFRRAVEQRNRTLDEVFNDLHREWKKRHDRDIVKTLKNEKGQEIQYVVKAPVPRFPLTRLPDCRIRPVAQYPTLQAAEAKKKELAEKEAGLTPKASKSETDAPGPTGLKGPHSSSRGRERDAARRAEEGYLPDDLTEEQLQAELLSRFAAKTATGQKAPAPAVKPDK